MSPSNSCVNTPPATIIYFRPRRRSRSVYILESPCFKTATSEYLQFLKEGKKKMSLKDQYKPLLISLKANKKLQQNSFLFFYCFLKKKTTFLSNQIRKMHNSLTPIFQLFFTFVYFKIPPHFASPCFLQNQINRSVLARSGPRGVPESPYFKK